MLLVLYSYLKQEVFNPSEKSSARAARGVLSRFGVPRGYKVLSDIRLENNGDEVVIENMLIGYFGILLVRTLGTRGEYYGTLDADNWSTIVKEKKTVYENPVKHLAREEAVLRAVFSKNKIYNIPIEKIVYISSKSNKNAVYITYSDEILLGGKLGAYLDKSKFEKDTGLDIKKISEVITSAQTGSK